MGVFITRGWQCNIKIEYNVSHISTSQQVKYKIRKSDPVFIIFVGKLKKNSLAPPLEQFPLTLKVKNTLCQESLKAEIELKINSLLTKPVYYTL